MNNIKCPKCGKYNLPTKIRCNYCGEVLLYSQNDDCIDIGAGQENFNRVVKFGRKHPKLISTLLFILKFGPFILIEIIGIGMIAVSSFFIISEKDTSNYLETEGKFVSYEDCFYYKDGEELCKGVYEYTVDGSTYKWSPDIAADRFEISQDIRIKYNPDNPSECIIDMGWDNLLKVGIVIVASVSGFLFIVKLIYNFIANKISDFLKGK